MKSVFTIAEEEKWKDSDWLVMGKGPSLEKLLKEPWPGPIFALNHALEDLRRRDIKHDKARTIGHLIDLEVIDDIPDALLCECSWVVMPWIPNAKMHRGGRTLADLVVEHPIINALDKVGKLLYYNRRGSGMRIEDGGTVDVWYFSSEAAFDILGQAGVKRIVCRGLDGKATSKNGREYDQQFPLLRGMQTKYQMEVEGLP